MCEVNEKAYCSKLIYNFSYFHRPLPAQNGNASPILKRISSVLESSSKYDEVQPPPCTFVKRNSTGSVTLNLAPPPPEPVVVHAGAVVSMLHLVPAIHAPQAKQVRTIRWKEEVLKFC